MARSNKNQPIDPQAIAAVVAQVLASGNFSTPTAVVEATVEIDPVEALLQANGLRYAKGGRTYLSREALVAASRVLKTGTPELVSTSLESLTKRGITHIVLFREGDTVVSQFAFHPAS